MFAGGCGDRQYLLYEANPVAPMCHIAGFIRDFNYSSLLASRPTMPMYSIDGFYVVKQNESYAMKVVAMKEAIFR